MFESLIAILQQLLSLGGGIAAVPEPSALALAVAVIAALVLVGIAHVGTARTATARRGPHPRRAIDVSRPLTQSDPDAPGHPRPRAPQAASSAA